MSPNPFLGVLFHWLGGLASGSFYVPYRELGVQAAIGPAHLLRGLAPKIGSVLMQHDVIAVQGPQFPYGVNSQDREHLGEQPAGTPPAVARIDRVPRSVAPWQITPWHARAQNEKHDTVHYPADYSQPTLARHAAITRAPFFSRRSRSILLAASIETLGSTADLYNTCAGSDSTSVTRLHNLEDTT